MRAEARGAWLRWLEVAFGLVAAVVAIAVCARAPWRELPALVRRSGGRLPFTLVIWPLALACDAWAWRTLLRALDVRASWLLLWLIRLVSEAVLLSWPAGSVLAEIIKIGLLCRATGAPVAAVAATVAVKKVLVIGTEAPYLALAGAVGALRGLDGRFVALPMFAGAIALLVACVLGGLSARGAWASRLVSVAASLRSSGGRYAWLAAGLEDLGGAETGVRRLWKSGWLTLLPASLAVFAAWLFEAADLQVASWALRDPLLPWQAFYCDACAGFVRAAAFLVPGGWGAQDLGLVGLLSRVAHRTEGAAAWLAVIKRAKEVFFVVTGYSLGLGIKATWRKDRRDRIQPPSC